MKKTNIILAIVTSVMILGTTFLSLSTEEIKDNNSFYSKDYNLANVITLAKYLSNKIEMLPQNISYDVNNDGNINSDDILKMIKIIVGDEKIITNNSSCPEFTGLIYWNTVDDFLNDIKNNTIPNDGIEEYTSIINPIKKLAKERSIYYPKYVDSSYDVQISNNAVSDITYSNKKALLFEYIDENLVAGAKKNGIIWYYNQINSEWIPPNQELKISLLDCEVSVYIENVNKELKTVEFIYDDIKVNFSTNESNEWIIEFLSKLSIEKIEFN